MYNHLMNAINIIGFIFTIASFFMIKSVAQTLYDKKQKEIFIDKCIFFLQELQKYINLLKDEGMYDEKLFLNIKVLISQIYAYNKVIFSIKLKSKLKKITKSEFEKVKKSDLLIDICDIKEYMGVEYEKR